MHHKTSIFSAIKAILIFYYAVALTLEEVAVLQGNIDYNALGEVINGAYKSNVTILSK
jgi:hypothetical protein